MSQRFILHAAGSDAYYRINHDAFPLPRRAPGRARRVHRSACMPQAALPTVSITARAALIARTAWREGQASKPAARAIEEVIERPGARKTTRRPWWDLLVGRKPMEGFWTR